MERKPKIITDNKIPFLKGRLEAAADVIYADPDKIDAALVADADALIVRTRTKCNSSLLKGSSVKLIATATIGTDHIDLDWCERCGITVRNAAGCNAPGVAQYVWSSLMRNGFDPQNDTLGVVGYGNIGSIVTDWGNKMGCRVLVCDPLRKKAGMTDRNYLPLDYLLNEADAVTLHTPLTKDGDFPTFHMISSGKLDMMKRGAILINAARGGVVDNEAWDRHLAQGRTKAIIDTWEGEPDINLSLMSKATIATPHIAGYSLEGKQRATRMALEAVEEYFGIQLDKTGLEGQYISPETISTDSICSSYNPFSDTDILKKNPTRFEELRSRYDYRKEPSSLT